ncbi:MAG: YhfC family glutamic-type intramembrane protease [Anaerolineae bacterium]
MNIPLLTLILMVQLPLMLVLPVLVGWWIRRRYSVGWRIYWIGGVTFVISQVVHLPINYAVGLLTGTWGVGLWPLPLMALVAGLSAGVCEQSARWAMLRYLLRGARSWKEALQFGAGHGGIEAIILGLIALSAVGSMVVIQTSGVQALGLEGEAAAQAEQSLRLFWGAPWYTPLLAGLERSFTIAFHICMAVLVMRAITHSQFRYFLAAVAAHMLFDAWAVWGSRTLDLLPTELGLAIGAAVALWATVRLRDEPHRHHA